MYSTTFIYNHNIIIYMVKKYKSMIMPEKLYDRISKLRLELIQAQQKTFSFAEVLEYLLDTEEKWYK